MNDLKIRNIGLDIIGTAPWGTHFCFFYESKKDIFDVLIPYFKEGLENNELCIWVTSEPLTTEDIETSLKELIVNIDEKLEEQQIEINPFVDFYLKNDMFKSQRVIDGWISKLNYALSKGYDGLRIAGNIPCLKNEISNAFSDYEKEFNEIIPNHQIIAVCLYSINNKEISELIDIVLNHQFNLIKKEGKWDFIETNRDLEEKVRILIVDDDETSIKTLTLIFEKLGYVTEIAVTGREALVKYIKGFFNIIFLDVKLPDIDGIDLIKPLKKLQPELEVIMITGYATLELAIRAVNEGASAFIIKPLNMDKVLDILKKSQERQKLILEKRKIEEDLQKSEAKYKDLYENAPIAYFSVDVDKKIRQCNRAALDLLGYTKEEITKMGVLDLYASFPESLPKVKMIIQRFQNNEVIKHEEHQMKKKNGNLIWIDLNIQPILNKTGEVVGSHVVVINITERKKAEKKKLKSENRLLYAQKIARLGFWDLNLITGELYWSDETYRIFGFKPQEFVPNYEKFRTVVHPDDLDFVQKHVDVALQDDIKYNIDFRIVRPNGVIRYVNAQGNVTRDAATDKPVRFIGTQINFRDITERKKTEDQLRLHSEIMANMSDGVNLVREKDGLIVYTNPRFDEMFGYNPGELIGEHV